jgi:hypothetical protein
MQWRAYLGDRTILSETLPFASLIILDPFLFPGRMDHLEDVRQRLVQGALRRRALWRTRDEAREYLKKGGWDPEVLELYLVNSVVFFGQDLKLI